MQFRFGPLQIKEAKLIANHTVLKASTSAYTQSDFSKKYFLYAATLRLQKLKLILSNSIVHSMYLQSAIKFQKEISSKIYKDECISDKKIMSF